MGVTIKGMPPLKTQTQLKGPVALIRTTIVVCSTIVDLLLTMAKLIITIIIIIYTIVIATRVQAMAEIVIVVSEVERLLQQRAQITMNSIHFSTQRPKGTTIICLITTNPLMIIEATKLEEVTNLVHVALTITITTTKEIITIRT